MMLRPGVAALYLLLSTQASGSDAAPMTGNNAAPPLVIGGTQIAEKSSYSYLGLIRPIWGGKLGQGWFHTTIASWLTYEYGIGANNQAVTVDAKAPGIDTGLGYAWYGTSYSVNVSLAAGYRYFILTPDIAGEKPVGSVYNLTPQLQAGYRFSESLDTDIISNYSFGQQSNFNRLRLGWMAVNGWRIGLEGVYQSGRNYRIQQQGLFIATDVGKGINLSLSGGNLEQKDGSGSAYFGLAFSRLF